MAVSRMDFWSRKIRKNLSLQSAVLKFSFLILHFQFSASESLMMETLLFDRFVSMGTK